MSCCTCLNERLAYRSKRKAFQQVAADRARNLGFLANEEVFSAPINIQQETAKSVHNFGQMEEFQRLDETLSGSRLRQVERDLDIINHGYWTEVVTSIERGAIVLDEMRDAEKKGRENRVEIPKGTKLLAWCSSIHPVLHGNTWNRLRRLGRFLCSPLVDRTETLSSGLEILNLFPILPFDEQWRMTLEEIMLARAEQILKASLDKEEEEDIYVLWSGGIDTTGVVCAFLRVTEKPEYRNMRKRLVISYCERSKNENPRFYKQFIKDKLRELVISGHVRDIIDGRKVVTGDPADMIFGTFAMADCLVPYIEGKKNLLFTRLDDPWREVFWAALEQSKIDFLPQERKEEWVTWIEPFVEKCPIRIVSYFDFLWWASFGLKYQSDLLRIFYNRPDLSEAIYKTVINFYHSYDFQQWSYHCHHLKMTDHMVWGSYKAPLKKFIFDYDKDEEYYSTKTKVISVMNSWGAEVGIDENFNVIRFGKYSISRKRMREKYGDGLYTFMK